MKIFTIGFTKKTAESFFGMLQNSKVKHLVDIRLNNVSQLAGFAKRDDLKYFLQAICNIDYTHLPILAPNQEMLDSFKKAKGSWESYEKQFVELMAIRRVEDTLSHNMFDNSCLLCSEDRPDHCHRRLVAEYLKSKWEDVQVEHLI